MWGGQVSTQQDVLERNSLPRILKGYFGASRWFGWLCLDGSRLDAVQNRVDLLWPGRPQNPNPSLQHSLSCRCKCRAFGWHKPYLSCWEAGRKPARLLADRSLLWGGRCSAVFLLEDKSVSLKCLKLIDFHWWADQVSIRGKAFISISLTACNFEHSGQNCRLIVTRGQCIFLWRKRLLA